ncbi:MAG TPA: nickel-dependent lactate racemase [Geothermobacteraceae bacterium]|nr:nickel-dependent lactate racemase [Geothermobacteraceae bacterium]
MSHFALKYGRQTCSAEIPGARALQVKIPRVTRDSHDLVRQSLAAPIGSLQLQQIVRPGEQVVIVTSDITRYTGSEIFLPILVELLNDCGIPDRDIRIVIGLGIHRAQTAEEHQKILGPLAGRIEVCDHDCDNSEQLVDLGATTSGLPVEINRTVVEAERVIVTGTAGLHYFAGFGGGRKGLVPGVASRKTCMATHFAIFNPPQTGGKHPQAVPGRLDGNPVHQAILEAALKVKPDFLLNTVLAPDKSLLKVYCGDLDLAHRAACELAGGLYQLPLAEPADLAVVSCGGAPKDINFIQAHKALDYGVRALRPGGTVILLAECPDGFGNATFFDWFRYLDLAEFETALRNNYEINGQTAHSTLSKARQFRVILISSFSREQTKRMGMEKAANLDAALQMAYEKLPDKPRTVVIPDGGTVLPVIQGS